MDVEARANKVHGTNIGPIWGRQYPGGPYIVPTNFAIRGASFTVHSTVAEKFISLTDKDSIVLYNWSLMSEMRRRLTVTFLAQKVSNSEISSCYQVIMYGSNTCYEKCQRQYSNIRNEINIFGFLLGIIKILHVLLRDIFYLRLHGIFQYW